MPSPPEARYVPPALDELQRMAQAIINANRDEVALQEAPHNMPLEVGHAAVARNRQLLSGVLALVGAELTDVCGPLFRVIYETWLVGLYGLLGGPDALERLLSQQDKHLGPIAKLLGGPKHEPGVALPVEQLAREVATLLEERGNDNACFPTAAYESFYRYESYRSIHGGLGSVERSRCSRWPSNADRASPS